MGYKVILSPEAIQRLEQIVRLIAKDNPDAARRFGLKHLTPKTSPLTPLNFYVSSHPDTSIF